MIILDRYRSISTALVIVKDNIHGGENDEWAFTHVYIFQNFQKMYDY